MLVVGLTVGGPAGCLIGSPVAAISGEPYGMTIDDAKSLQGKKGRIWSGAPFFAAVDIPFAAVLDTAFLPISLLVWGIRALASDEGEDDTDPTDGGTYEMEHADDGHARDQVDERGEHYSR